MNYKDKYIKYKKKYLLLKNLIGGDIDISDCKIYTNNIQQNQKIYLATLNQYNKLDIKLKINFENISKYKSFKKYICPKNKVIQLYFENISNNIQKNYLDLLKKIGKIKDLQKFHKTYHLDLLKKKLIAKHKGGSIKELENYSNEFNWCNYYSNFADGINNITMKQTLEIQENNNYDILILGMGPIGLLLANILLDRYVDIKIVILDNRIDFNYYDGDEKKILKEYTKEGVKQPFSMDISSWDNNLDSLNNIISNELLQFLKEQNEFFCKFNIKMYLNLLKLYNDRIKTLYTKKNFKEIIKTLNIDIVLDATGGRNMYSNKYIDSSIMNNIKTKNIDGTYSSIKNINKEDIPQPNLSTPKDPVDYQQLYYNDDYYFTNFFPNDNYKFVIKKKIDPSVNSVELQSYKKKLERFNITPIRLSSQNKKLYNVRLYNYLNKLLKDDNIILEEKIIENIVDPILLISKKEISNIHDNFINILCGSGLIKTSPQSGQTLELGIEIFICYVLAEFDNSNLFKLNNNDNIQKLEGELLQLKMNSLVDKINILLNTSDT